MDKEFIENIVYYGKAIGFRDAVIALLEISLSENIKLPENIKVKLEERMKELYPLKRKNDNESFDEEPPEIDSDFGFDPFMGQFTDEV